MAKRESYVYVVSMTDTTFVKVGVSSFMSRRICEMQSGNPHKLLVEFTKGPSDHTIAYQVERRAHHLLRDKSHSGEWFRCEPAEAITAIEDAFKFVRNRRGELGYEPCLKRQRDLGINYGASI